MAQDSVGCSIRSIIARPFIDRDNQPNGSIIPRSSAAIRSSSDSSSISQRFCKHYSKDQRFPRKAERHCPFSLRSESAATEAAAAVQKQDLPVQSENSTVVLSKSLSSCCIQRAAVEFSRSVAAFSRAVVEFTCRVVEILVQLSDTPSSCRIHAKSQNHPPRACQRWV